MNRLLYFTGFRMVAQEWNGHKLMSSVFFEPDENGFESFKTYLSTISKEPIRLLVDLIEEEFRPLSIPLVSGSDRKALILRNSDKLFRLSKFSHAYRQSIDKKSKKKVEHLILAGVTNPSLLEPWLAIINAIKMPLAGIVSLPIISEHFVQTLHTDNDCVILVSQQVPSNLRQSVFIKGRLVLSRLVPIATFYQGDYSTDVLRDIESTQRYLVSQKLIERSERVTVHVLTNMRHIDMLTIACGEKSQYDFSLYNINDVLIERGVKFDEEQDFSSALFCHETSKIRVVDHYARRQDKRYMKHYRWGLSLKAAGIAVFIIGLGLGISNAIQGTIYQKNIVEMNQLKQQYEKQYQLRSAHIEPLSITPTEMKQAVETSRIIDINYQHSPQVLLTKISKSLQLFADIRATDIEWFVSNNKDNLTREDVTWGKSKKKKKRSKGKVKKDNFKGHYEIVILTGEFIDFNGDYRYALSVLSDLEDLLSESGHYDGVEIIEKPLDISERGTLNGAAKEEIKTIVEARFKIKITLKVPLNV